MPAITIEIKFFKKSWMYPTSKTALGEPTCHTLLVLGAQVTTATFMITAVTMDEITIVVFHWAVGTNIRIETQYFSKSWLQ